jgi:hypothetical protein
MSNKMLTPNDARVLQVTNLHEGAYLYELASVLQITFAEAFLAAERLAGQGYLVLDEDLGFVHITKEGRAARCHTGGFRRVLPTVGSASSPLAIKRDGRPAAAYMLEEMPESDVPAAIERELSKY